MLVLNEIKYREKRSEFIAILYKCDSFSESSTIISMLKQQHPQAKHVLACGHFQVGNVIREDGEPIKSMHLLVKRMEREKLYDYLVCIVRYYGGINLGQNNLSKVYFKLGEELLDSH